MTRLLFVSLVLLLGCGACDEVQRAADGVQRSDSAGLEIIRHLGSAATNPPQMLLEERLRIGTVSGPDEYQFFSLVDAAIDDDGTLYALDRGNRVVRVYDQQGQHLRSFGRRGDGPGEFSAPYGIELHDDRITVLDRLVHTFRQDGELLRAVQPELPERTYLWSLAVAGDAWLGEIRTPIGGPESPMDGTRNELLVVRLNPTDLAPMDTLVRVPGQRMYALGPMGFHATPLFEPEPKVVISSSAVASVGSGAYVIMQRGANSVWLRRIEVAADPQPVTEELVDEYIRSERERIASRPSNPETEPLTEAMLELRPQLEMPAQRPVVGRLLVSNESEMLVERLDLDLAPFDSADEVIWDYFSSEGELIGQFRTPPTIRPLLLDKGAIWAVVRDELDVQYFVQYQILSSTSAAG